MTTELSTFDPSEKIRTDEQARLWLAEFAADGTAEEFVAAIGDVARAYGMIQLAKQTGIPVNSLFAALNRHPPSMAPLLPILDALGVSISGRSDAAE